MHATKTPTSTRLIPRSLAVLTSVAAFAACSLVTLFSEDSAKQQPPGEPFSFVQMCDTQLGMGGYEHDVRTFRQAVGLINGMKPDFVVICGDLVQKADDKSFADFNDIKSGFKLPCYCASGNHDVENQPTAASLKKYREKVGPDYYTFEHKGFTFVVANTQLWKAPLAGESEKHDAWFKKSLEDAKAKKSPVVVVVHYPMFIKEPDEKEVYFNLPVDKRKELLALCEENGVAAILGGHLHKFQAREYKGILLVNGETTSKNFDKRPMGFRWWDVDEKRGMKHRFVVLEESAIQAAARKSLNETANAEVYPGSVTAQARVDGVSYQPLLKKAIDLDAAALVSLFETQFVGEGAEAHSAVLLQLMQLWGDEKYAAILGKQAEDMQGRVVVSIDYAWAEPQWSAYAKTQALSPDSIKARPK